MEHYDQNPSSQSPDMPGTPGQETSGQAGPQGQEQGPGEGATATATKVKENVKEKFNQGTHKVREGIESSRQATSSRLRNASHGIRDLETRLGQGMEQAREKTSAGLEATSRRVESMAEYLEQHDSRQMWEDMKVVVRRNPGRSVIAGLLVGLFVGRIMR